MREVRIQLTEPEASALEALASQSGISLEEAVVRAVRYVLKEVMSVSPDFYGRLRSQMFWEHYRHLQSILKQGGVR